MTKDEFMDKMWQFVSGPEHNAFYDTLDILEVSLDVMTNKQRKKVFDVMSEKKPVNNPYNDKPATAIEKSLMKHGLKNA